MTFSSGIEDFTCNVKRALDTAGETAEHLLKAVVEPAPRCADGGLLSDPHTGLFKIDPETVLARAQMIDTKLRECGVLPLLNIGLDQHCLPQIKIDCPPPVKTDCPPPFKTDCFGYMHVPGVLDGRALPPGLPGLPQRPDGPWNGGNCKDRETDKQVDLFLHNLGELAKHPGLIIDPRF